MKNEKQGSAKDALITKELKNYIERIVQALIKKVYFNDFEIANSAAQLISQMHDSELFTKERAKELIGVWQYALRKKDARFDSPALLSVFFHDISGTVNEHFGFLPKSTNYRKYYDPSLFNIKNEILLP